MRGGIQSAKEDWRSGSCSALAGGVTVVVDQPNTVPPLTDPQVFSARVREAASHSLCSFAINGGVTKDADLEGLWESGAMLFEIFCPVQLRAAVWSERSVRILRIKELAAWPQSMQRR
jgi:dihydroorotase